MCNPNTLRKQFKVAIRLSRLSRDLRVAWFGRGSDLSSDEARTRLGGEARTRQGSGEGKAYRPPRVCETLDLSGESVSETDSPHLKPDSRTSDLKPLDLRCVSQTLGP